MALDFEAFFFRKISSFVSLMLVVFIASVLAVIMIHQSQKLLELQKPLPLYIKIQADNNIND